MKISKLYIFIASGLYDFLVFTDQISMKTDLAFGDILESFESNTPIEDSTTSMSAGWETVLDPAGLAYLIGKTSVFTSVRSTPYAKIKTQRLSHSMNSEQLAAFAALTKWTPGLKDNFNLKELKSNYRLALLKTHPDQGGSSENFWAVKKSYEVLVSLVKS